jgi:hypothetical protein
MPVLQFQMISRPQVVQANEHMAWKESWNFEQKCGARLKRGQCSIFMRQCLCNADTRFRSRIIMCTSEKQKNFSSRMGIS